AAWSLKPAPPVAVSRFALTLPDIVGVSGPGRHQLAISRDGTRMAFVAGTRLYLRSMADLDTKPVQGTEMLGSVIEPVFSPDGQYLAFFSSADNAVKRVPVTGGAAFTISPAAPPYGMTWGETGLVFAHPDEKGIVRVSPNSGTPVSLVTLKENERAHAPQILPGGETLLFTLTTGNTIDRSDKADIVAQSLKTGERKRLLHGGSDARYLPTGHLVYALGGTLFAVAFDAARLEVIGGPVPVVEGVRRSPGTTSGAAQYDVSATGTI